MKTLPELSPTDIKVLEFLRNNTFVHYITYNDFATRYTKQVATVTGMVSRLITPLKKVGFVSVKLHQGKYILKITKDGIDYLTNANKPV